MKLRPGILYEKIEEISYWPFTSWENPATCYHPSEGTYYVVQDGEITRVQACSTCGKLDPHKGITDV